MTLEDLREQGFPQLVLEAVDRLTKKPDVARADYFAAIRAHAVARVVKTADLIDNTDPERAALLGETTRSRLAEKYAESWALLLGDA
ncbi:guanosine-3',5'-bis(Diphosphate) 3'-pyrophosphohydrolase [Brachybacterium sp. SW0106-09]|nr:guanosine-3',5'-bis(Diphosphate) 3'-pyrophosphohydrolase [Brachybacterium sp. SW0106-09]